MKPSRMLYLLQTLRIQANVLKSYARPNGNEPCRLLYIDRLLGEDQDITKKILPDYPFYNIMEIQK